MPKQGNLDGTREREFYIGEGDIDTLDTPAIGIRSSDTGSIECRESGKPWTSFENCVIEVLDTILVSSEGEVLTSIEGNVLVSG